MTINEMTINEITPEYTHILYYNKSSNMGVTFAFEVI